jgi:DNA replication protein DnaC
MVLRERNGEWYASPCRCVEQKAIERMIETSGLDDNEREIRLVDFNVTKSTIAMFKAVHKYLEEFPELYKSRAIAKGLALAGWVGVGKTMLVQAIANEFLDRRIPVVFVVTPALIGELRASQFEPGGRALEEKIEALSAVEVAIFDDVSKESVTEWVQTSG